MKELNINSDKLSLRKVLVGSGVKFFDFVNAYECSIGDNTKVGTFVEIQRDVKIGANCKISSHSFLSSGLEVNDEVFIGHGVKFVNDRFPRATNTSGELQNDADWKMEKIVVGRGASIGTNATIMCGVTIGEGSMVGAGSVVTKNVPDRVVVAGNPAKVLRNI